MHDPSPRKIFADELQKITLGRPIAGLGHVVETHEAGDSVVIHMSKGVCLEVTIKEKKS